MIIDSYNDPCAPNFPAPPPVGFASGSMFVDGEFIGTFTWIRAGIQLEFVPPGTIRGEGTWQPHPPIPTCASPGQLNATISGEIQAV